LPDVSRETSAALDARKPGACEFEFEFNDESNQGKFTGRSDRFILVFLCWDD
jgi:hypothetical protein